MHMYFFQTFCNVSKQFLFCSSLTVDNFQGERLYLVSMNISLCFEAYEDCLRQIIVLKDTLLPKRRCSWDTNTGVHLFLYLTVKHSVRFAFKRLTGKILILVDFH